jgi:hypothetical protein
MLLAVACSDDDDPTPTPTTTQTTPTGGNGGSGGAAAMTCDDACAALYVCGQDVCPHWEADDPTEDGWLNGSDGGGAPVTGCLDTCGANPTLIAIVNPDNCATTVATLAGLNAAFDASCNGAGEGGAGGATGGSGGAATGGSGGAATGGSGGAATGGSGGGN